MKPLCISSIKVSSTAFLAFVVRMRGMRAHRLEDEDLAVRLECDPEMMLHIGGPRPEADVRATHKRRLELMKKGGS